MCNLKQDNTLKMGFLQTKRETDLKQKSWENKLDHYSNNTNLEFKTEWEFL